jgi:Carboxypeptidase regulatory-like domain
MKRNILISCLAILTGSACVWAQTGTSSVRGTVMDKSGAAISGAHVTIVNAAQAVQRETNTNASGEYEVLALPPWRLWGHDNSRRFQEI